jgi:hypothetical protein
LSLRAVCMRWEHTFVPNGTTANAALRTLRTSKPLAEFAFAPKGARPARQLLPRLPGRVQARALRGQSRSLHRGRVTPESGSRPRASRVSDRVLRRAPLRQLRRARPARVLSSTTSGDKSFNISWVCATTAGRLCWTRSTSAPSFVQTVTDAEPPSGPDSHARR